MTPNEFSILREDIDNCKTDLLRAVDAVSERLDKQNGRIGTLEQANAVLEERTKDIPSRLGMAGLSTVIAGMLQGIHMYFGGK